MSIDHIGYRELRRRVAMFTDAQHHRIATFNRLHLKADGSPQAEGLNFLPVDPNVYAEFVAALMVTERTAADLLLSQYRQIVPAGVQEWQKETRGIGEHLLAMLLGYVGHPRVAFPQHWEGTGSERHLVDDEPFIRTIGQLWQYCGSGKPGRRERGMTAEEAMWLGNPAAKKTAYLLAAACLKSKGHGGSRYSNMYDLVKARDAEKVHTEDCVRCGPSGRPALTGSPWSKAHLHNHALRLVRKEILRDLWLVADDVEVPEEMLNPRVLEAV